MILLDLFIQTLHRREEGNIHYWQCITCKHYYEDEKALFELAADGVSHIMNAGSIAKAATCTEEGEKVYTCILCGETASEPLEMIDYTVVRDTCSSCNMCRTRIDSRKPLQNLWSYRDGAG